MSPGAAKTLRYVGLASALGLVVAGITFGAWQATGSFAEQRIAELVATEIRDTERAAEAIGRAVERRFAFMRGVPGLMADEEGLRSTIANGFDSKSSAASRRLARIARELELNGAWVTGSDGVCIAAANFDKPDSVVGTNFSDREYFQAAKRGEPVRPGSSLAVRSTSSAIASSPYNTGSAAGCNSEAFNTCSATCGCCVPENRSSANERIRS